MAAGTATPRPAGDRRSTRRSASSKDCWDTKRRRPEPGHHRGSPSRTGVLARAASLPIAIDRPDRQAGVHRDRVSDAVALRHPVGPRLLAAGRRRTRRTHGRGDRSGGQEARRARALAAREPASGAGALRDGRGRRRAEPLEHASSASRAALGGCPVGRSRITTAPFLLCSVKRHDSRR